MVSSTGGGRGARAYVHEGKSVWWPTEANSDGTQLATEEAKNGDTPSTECTDGVPHTANREHCCKISRCLLSIPAVGGVHTC